MCLSSLSLQQWSVDWSVTFLSFPGNKFDEAEFLSRRWQNCSHFRGLLRTLSNLKYHCRVHKAPPLFPSRRWNQSTPWHGIFLRSIRVSSSTCMNFSAFLCIPYVAATSIAPLQIMTGRIVLLFIIRLSLTNLWSKHSPQHSVLIQINSSTFILYTPFITFIFILPSLNHHLKHYLSHSKSLCLTNTPTLSALVGAIFRGSISTVNFSALQIHFWNSQSDSCLNHLTSWKVNCWDGAPCRWVSENRDLTNIWPSDVRPHTTTHGTLSELAKTFGVAILLKAVDTFSNCYWNQAKRTAVVLDDIG